MKEALILILLGCAFTYCTQQKAFFSEDEKQIREFRQQSNEAIANHDSIAVANYWTEDFHVISSRNFEVAGREANRQLFAQEFKTKKDVLYVRTSNNVQVFKEWNMASESGTWTGQWQEPDGMVMLSGNYYAKWHKINGSWKIRAEVFSPLTCLGSKFCDEHPKL